ncbi:MAG: DoxX family protein [Cyanothece sp. SIO1E1]|nr:DoxX family protein [Cyanothece sp. SIO1E1]
MSTTLKTWSSTILGSTLSPNLWLQVAWAVVRVAAGLLMIHNGLDKLADVEGFADNVVTFIGLPFPIFSTYCAAYIEIVGAILLSLGLLTRPAAIALLATMIVAIYFHLKDTGLAIPPLETASLYALCFLFFSINGSGMFAVDTLIASRFEAMLEEPAKAV